MKNGVNWRNDFNLRSVTLILKLSQTDEESFTFDIFRQMFLSTGSSCIQEFLFQARVYFSSKKGHH